MTERREKTELQLIAQILLSADRRLRTEGIGPVNRRLAATELTAAYQRLFTVIVQLRSGG